jgi:hypothetical protein
LAGAGEEIVVSEITTFTMSDRKPKDGSIPSGVRQRTVMAFDTDVDMFANEVQSPVSDERPRRQPRFAQDLKAIANAYDEPTLGGEAFH